jgi:3-deoxy-manno-octulosonate cytidylyltransferase (CMP-KDO synthetase)
MNREAIGIIPARYGSTRFEGKVLADIHGKPMVQHVYERALCSRRLTRCIVATDDARVVEAVEAFGGEAVLTAASHACGSDRVAEAASALAGISDACIIVNIQGDEPMLEPRMIDEVVDLLLQRPQAGMATLMRRIDREEDWNNPGFVKVVTDSEGMALYFSRSLIPFPRFRTPEFQAYDHIGIYAFTSEALARFAALGPSRLETIEGLEQLRALERGIRIAVAETHCDAETVCVDTVEDLERVRELLSAEVMK